MLILYLECYDGLITSLPTFILAPLPIAFWDLPSVQRGQVLPLVNPLRLLRAHIFLLSASPGSSPT